MFQNLFEKYHTIKKSYIIEIIDSDFTSIVELKALNGSGFYHSILGLISVYSEKKLNVCENLFLYLNRSSASWKMYLACKDTYPRGGHDAAIPFQNEIKQLRKNYLKERLEAFQVVNDFLQENGLNFKANKDKIFAINPFEMLSLIDRVK